MTPDNCVVALIDHQGQMLFGTSNFDRQGIINNTVALGKAARVFDVPVVLTTVETKSFSGNLWPQLRAVFPGQVPIERSSMNSWDDKKVREWLSVAAPVPGFIGFAVGRTTFWDPLVEWKSNRNARDKAVAEIARRYSEWVDIFEKARRG